MLAKKRWDTYKWNFERIDDGFKRDFAVRWQGEFRQIANAGLVNSRVFTVENHRMLQVLLRDVDLFVEWRTPVPEGASFKERLHHKFVTWRALQQTR